MQNCFLIIICVTCGYNGYNMGSFKPLLTLLTLAGKVKSGNAREDKRRIEISLHVISP